MTPTNRWRFNIWGITPKAWQPTLNWIRELPDADPADYPECEGVSK